MKFLFLLFIFFSGAAALATQTIAQPDAAMADQIPKRIHISYTVKTGVGQGELNEIVDIIQERDAHAFNIISDAQATGIFKVIKPGNIIRNSRGIVTDNGLQPRYFSDQRAKKEPSLALFDWENKTLTLKHKGKETIVSLSADTLDRLSLSYHFIFSPITADQAGKVLDFHVTDGRSVQLMQYKVGLEKLETPLGELDTIVLTKQFDHEDRVQRKIWLALRYHLIPVHIQSVEKDGLEVEKMVTEISLDYADDSDGCCKH